jgi:long-chain acyl-CoA synthetase
MQTLIELFEESVKKYPENPYLLEKKTDRYEPETYSQVKERVYQFAAGLISLGIKKGDRLALLSEGRNDWVVSELGIMYTGAINVPLSVRLEPADIDFRLKHSGTRIIIVSGNQSAKMKGLKDEIKSLEKVIIMDQVGELDAKDIVFAEVMELGKKYLEDNKPDFEKTFQSIKGNDYANICYTSGTTADPKGIILTHRNYTSNIEQSLTLMEVPEWYTTLLILPWDHAFAHTTGIYTLMMAGASLASIKVGKTPMETLKNIPVNIREVRPVFLLSVPALAKNFRKNIENAIREKGGVVEKLFRAGLKIAYTYNGNGWNRGKGLKILLKPIYKLFDIIIFKKIRANFGGRLKFFVGGGALLDIELQRFFYAIGMPMFQGYGLTEASPVISSNSEIKHKLGSSGYLVKPLELKIVDDDGHEVPVGEKGEIIIKGENVMAGYWNNPEATASTIKNGWLFTGDMGYLDKDEFLYVLGRFKSLLIADDGEKYSPEGIEEAFTEQSAFIDQCMLYNNQNPYTVALVVPNKEAIKRWLKDKNLQIETEEGQSAALKLIESEINEYRTGRKYGDMFPQRWLPPAIGVLSEGFTDANQMMNSTMKMVRGKITEHYQDRIDYLYTPEAKNISNKENLEAIRKIFLES